MMHRLYLTLIGGLIAAFFLASCTRLPLEITKATISPKPIVGQVVTLQVQLVSTNNESNVEVTLNLPDEVEIISEDKKWTGSLLANKTQSLNFDLRVAAEGEWPISVNVTSILSETSSYGDSKILYVISSPTKASVSNNRSSNNWYPPTERLILPAPELDERFESTLTLSRVPDLGREFDITYSLLSTIDIPEATVSLAFPLLEFDVISATFPDGNIQTYLNNEQPRQLSWSGSLVKDKPIQLTGTFRINDTGYGEVVGFLTLYEPEGEATRILQTASAMTYLEITDFSSRYKIISPKLP